MSLARPSAPQASVAPSETTSPARRSSCSKPKEASSASKRLPCRVSGESPPEKTMKNNEKDRVRSTPKRAQSSCSSSTCSAKARQTPSPKTQVTNSSSGTSATTTSKQAKVAGTSKPAPQSTPLGVAPPVQRKSIKRACTCSVASASPVRAPASHAAPASDPVKKKNGAASAPPRTSTNAKPTPKAKTQSSQARSVPKQPPKEPKRLQSNNNGTDAVHEKLTTTTPKKTNDTETNSKKQDKASNTNSSASQKAPKTPVVAPEHLNLSVSNNTPNTPPPTTDTNANSSQNLSLPSMIDQVRSSLTDPNHTHNLNSPPELNDIPDSLEVSSESVSATVKNELVKEYTEWFQAVDSDSQNDNKNDDNDGSDEENDATNRIPLYDSEEEHFYPSSDESMGEPDPDNSYVDDPNKEKRIESYIDKSIEFAPRVNVGYVLQSDTMQCIYPRTSLTLQSNIPNKLERSAFAVLELICTNIYDNGTPFKYNEKNYNFYLTLLFYFFPIFLTGDTKSGQIQDIETNLINFAAFGQLPTMSPDRLAKNLDMKKQRKGKQHHKKKDKAKSPLDEMPFHTKLPAETLSRMINLCKAKRYRRALNCLQQSDVADPTDPNTLELFKKLHPQRDCDYQALKEELHRFNPNEMLLEEEEGEDNDNDDDNDGITCSNTKQHLTLEEQMTAIMVTLIGKLKDDKAVGPTNWNNAAIKQCANRCNHFVKALVVIALQMGKGKFPYPDFLTDAFLIGIWKDEQHSGIRPIAIANNLSKLLITAAWKHRMLLWSQNSKAKGLPIQYNQFGISLSGGAELPAFMVGEYFNQGTLLQTISLDITNAFNSISREAILRQVKIHLPPLLPLVELLYLHDSRLFLSSGDIILSKQGVRQGCPLSPLLFSLAIDKVLKEENKMAREYGAQVVAYLDDHTFIQTKTKAKKELTLEKIQKRIQPLLTELNLELNKEKCYIFEPEPIPASWYPQQDIESEQVENNQEQQKKTRIQKSNKKGQKIERNDDDETESESELEIEKEKDTHTMSIEEL